MTLQLSLYPPMNASLYHFFYPLVSISLVIFLIVLAVVIFCQEIPQMLPFSLLNRYIALISQTLLLWGFDMHVSSCSRLLFCAPSLTMSSLLSFSLFASFSWSFSFLHSLPSQLPRRCNKNKPQQHVNFNLVQQGFIHSLGHNIVSDNT